MANKKQANKKQANKLNSLRQRAHNGMDNVIDKAESVIDKAESISENSKEMMAHQREKAIMIGDDISNYIRKKPIRSVLIASGIGAIIAMVIKRRGR